MNIRTLNIFRAGIRKTMAGEVIEFSAQDVARTAAAYDKRRHVAPLVLGHPAHDDPALGAVQTLRAKGADLYADVSVSDKLMDMVKKDEYISVSSKFYRPTDVDNPVPGVFSLRHVGFLGAALPAIKGLDAPAFAEAGGVCFSEPLALTPIASGLHQDICFSENPAGFDEAVKAYMRSHPGVSYACAAAHLDGLSRQQASFRKNADPERLRQYEAIISRQQATPGLSFAQAIGEFFSSTPARLQMLPVAFAESRDTSRQADHAAILKLQAQNPGMSYSDAANKYFR